MTVDLTQLKAGQRGAVVNIQGGRGAIAHLSNMGIRPGKKLTKISAQFWLGPQIIKIDNLQVAVGFGMAKKIFLEVEE